MAAADQREPAVASRPARITSVAPDSQPTLVGGWTLEIVPRSSSDLIPEMRAAAEASPPETVWNQTALLLAARHFGPR